MKAPVWLTHEEIDSVLDRMSARDLIDAMGDDGKRGPKMIALAFDTAAARAGLASNGTNGSDRVSVQDFKYLAERMGEVINVDNPKSETSET